MVSVSTEASSIINQIINLNSPSSLYKKSSKRSLLELTRKSTSKPSDEYIISQFWGWFNSLSISEKQKSLTLYHPFLTEIIRKMHFKKLSEGEIVFSLEPAKGRISDEDLFEAIFKVTRRSFSFVTDSVEFQELEKQVEESVRLSDTYGYLDTLTVISSMVEQVIELIEKVSRNEAFQTPCRGFWDSAFKKTVFELPEWLFSCKEASLAFWVSAVLEQSIWISFWEYYDEKEYKPEVNLESVSVYFTEIPRFSQISLVGNQQEEVEVFNKIAAELSNGKHFENWSFSVVYLTGVNHYGVYSLIDFNKSLNLTETLNRACLYRSVKSVENIEQAFEQSSPEAFFEFISCSPLIRTGSPFDLLCRKILLNIKNAFTEKNAQDLLEEEAQRRPLEKPKKKEHKTSYETSSSTCSPESPIFSIPTNTPKHKFTNQNSLENLEGFKLVTPIKFRKKLLRTNTRKSKTRKNEWLNRQKPIEPVKKFPPAERNPPTSLASEIFRFSSFTCNKIQSRTSDIQIFLNSFKNLLEKINLDFQITLFGSYPTGLALPNSDLDLLLTNSQMNCLETIQVICNQLAITLMYLPWVCNIKAIPTARVPVIKLQIDMCYFNPLVTAKVDIDISFDSSILNPKNGVATMKMTKELLETHRHMKSLVIVIKEILSTNELNSAYLGGLSSYAVSIWVCTYIKLHSFLKIDSLLVGFLEFFGCEFDPQKTGVCIYTGFFGLEESMAHSVTRDPMDLSLNVTRTAYKINDVLKLFATAHSVLKGKNKLRDIFKPLIN